MSANQQIVYVLTVWHGPRMLRISAHHTDVDANMAMEQFVRRTHYNLPDDPGQAITEWCNETYSFWQVDECELPPDDC
jgi:hypothetical protein